MPSDLAVLHALQAEVAGWRDGIGEKLAQAMSKDVEAALLALEDVKTGRLLVTDAEVIVRRRLEAATWTTIRQGQDEATRLAIRAGTVLLKMVIGAILAA